MLKKTSCKSIRKFLSLLAISLFVNAHHVSANEHAALIITVVTDADEEVQLNMLSGLLKGLDGVKSMPAPKGWDTLNAKLRNTANKDLKSIVTQLNQKFGNPEAIQSALASLTDEKTSLENKRLALESLVSQKHADLLPALKGLLNGTLQQEAIRAYGAYNEKSIPGILLDHYSNADTQGRRTVIETLATREDAARALVSAMKSGSVKKEDIPAYVARNLKGLLGKSFADIYGDIQELSGDKSTLIASYKKKLTSPAFAKANASAGRAVYQRTCAACHKLYDAGGLMLGPELTGSNRADSDYILLNIIDPNFDVPEAYRMVTITKKDGQVLAGMVQEEDDNKLVLNMVGVKTRVTKSDIENREVSNMSMMPEGLLTTLNDKDFFDLIKYLQTTHQVELPK
jgi:putative heme-binding domain-containing protein